MTVWPGLGVRVLAFPHIASAISPSSLMPRSEGTIKDHPHPRGHRCKGWSSELRYLDRAGMSEWPCPFRDCPS